MTHFEGTIRDYLFAESKDTLKRIEPMPDVLQQKYIMQEITRLKNEVARQRRLKGQMTRQIGKLSQLSL